MHSRETMIRKKYKNPILSVVGRSILIPSFGVVSEG